VTEEQFDRFIEAIEVFEATNYTQFWTLVGLVVVAVIAALSPIIVAFITNGRKRKEKRVEMYFEHQIDAYAEYIDKINNIMHCLTIDDINKTIYNDNELKKIYFELRQVETKAIIFANAEMTIKMSALGVKIYDIVQQSDIDNLNELTREIERIVVKILLGIQKEIRNVNK